MRVQLWSYNYAPEPTGIGPVSTVWAEALQALGHEVSVVAAHPHYPAPIWGRRRLAYRENRNGIPVLRLPLWVGRDTGAKRLLQELSFTFSQALALPALGRPDVVVSVTPSFPALLPAIAHVRIRRVPWVVWIQDLLPDGAVTTGVIDEGPVLNAALRLERAAYASASRIVVVSDTFRRRLLEKGVPASKVDLVYNPSTRLASERAEVREPSAAKRLFTMGNIGHSQGLVSLVETFQADPGVQGGDVRLAIAGDGVAAADLRRAISGDHVEMLGLLDDERLEQELRRADIAVVSQRPDIEEFNLPSKLMNFLAYGLPVVAAVRPTSEVARLVDSSGGGRVVDSSAPAEFAPAALELLADQPAREKLSEAGFEFARENLAPAAFAARFVSSLEAAAGRPA